MLKKNIDTLLPYTCQNKNAREMRKNATNNIALSIAVPEYNVSM
jgi:hypothetical protein